MSEHINDDEIRAAVVQGVAQYILRGRAHTKRPPHTPAMVLARARRDMADVAQYGYTFHEGDAQKIADEAAELAQEQQERNINWVEWAWGK